MKPHPTKSKPRIAPYLAPRPPAPRDAEWAARYLREHFSEEVRLYLVSVRSTAPSWDSHEQLVNALLLKFARHAPADSASAQLAYLKDYVIPEKDKHGKYWHDLAQERIAQLAAAQSEVGRLTKERDELRAQLERLTAPIPDAEEYAKHVIAHLYPDHSNGARLVQIALNEWLNRHLATLRRERDELRADQPR